MKRSKSYEREGSRGCGGGGRRFWIEMMSVLALAAVMAPVFVSAAPVHGDGDATRVAFEHDGEQGAVDVYVRGEHFTTYHYGEQHARTPFLWPVHAEGGVGVTRNYPMGEDDPSSPDHPHHRSLFIAAVVNGHDFFHGRRGVRIDTEELTTGKADGYGWIRAHNRWLDGDEAIVLEEVTELRFHDTASSARTIDLTTTFKATHGEICFRDSGKYAFLAVRVRPEIEGDRDGTITNAHGDQGGGDVLGKPSPWVDYSGFIEGHGQRGIALLDHPANFRAPFVFVREYGLAMLNPFGNGGDESYALAKGESLTLRYRIYVHSGDVDEADVAGQYRRYAEDENVLDKEE